jgi:hypothetical protein
MVRGWFRDLGVYGVNELNQIQKVLTQVSAVAKNELQATLQNINDRSTHFLIYLTHDQVFKHKPVHSKLRSAYIATFPAKLNHRV